MEVQISTEDYVRALTENTLKPHQRKMLELNYYSPNHTITATEMAHRMGYRNFNAANLHYGKLGSIIKSNLGIEQKLEYLVSFLVSFKKVFKEWNWVMRPELVTALEELGWVNK